MTPQRDGWRFFGWWRIVLPAFLIILTTNTLTLAGLNVFDAALLTALQVDRAELKVGDTLLLLAAAASAPVGGWVADRYGVRPALVAGLLLLAAGLYAHSRVQSLGEVYLLRLLLGASLGGAGVVICVTLVSRWFVARRGLALGLMLAGTSLGNALYPSLNAWLIARHGWREALALIALAPLLLLPLVLFVIKDSPARAGLQPLGALPRPDGAGSRGTPAAAGDLAAALRARDFWLIATAGFCTFFALLGFSNNLFLHVRDLGYDDAAAARAYFPLFAMGLIGKLGAGALSEWLPRKMVFLLFLGLMLAGSVLFATLDTSLLWPGLWIFGLGWGGNYTLLQALAVDVFGIGSLGRILGSLTVIEAVGGALGPFVLALLFRASDSYQTGFLLMSGLIALALAAAMAVRMPRPAVA